MENLAHKANFLKNEYTKLLTQLDADAPGKWGKMNVQQMIEHMADYVRIASGRSTVPSLTPEEQVPRMQAFLGSEKPFRENTPNQLLPDEPPAVRNATKEAAVAELQDELEHFFQSYETAPGRAIPSPFFGVLNYDMQVQLLHKHSTHHLRQFGVEAQ